VPEGKIEVLKRLLAGGDGNGAGSSSDVKPDIKPDVKAMKGGQGSFKKGKRVMLHGLQARPDLNFKAGRVLAFDAGLQRYQVQLDIGQEIMAREANLKAL